jgi:hypothetical protein
MKAEHRKQLETNALAKRVSTTVESAKSHPQRLAVAGGIIVLIVVGVIAYYYYYSARAATLSHLWTRLNTATEVKDFEEIANDGPGTLHGRVAKFQLARRLLTTLGLEQLAAEKLEQRQSAAANVEKARSEYDGLYKEVAAADEKLLAREALLGQAKAEEALAGVPKLDNPGQARGSLDKALELYRKVAQDYPDSFQGQEADKRIKEFESKRAEFDKFYDQLRARFVARSEAPKPPAMPPLNTGPLGPTPPK